MAQSSYLHAFVMQILPNLNAFDAHKQVRPLNIFLAFLHQHKCLEMDGLYTLIINFQNSVTGHKSK